MAQEEHKIITDILKNYMDEFLFYYYGSRVKGNFNKTSDFDILLKGANEMSLFALVQLKEKMDESKLPYIVNFTDYNSIDKIFYNLIKDDLVLIATQ